MKNAPGPAGCTPWTPGKGMKGRKSISSPPTLKNATDYWKRIALTPAEWEKEQGLDVYREVEELFNQVTSAQRIWGDHKLDGKVQSMVILACYNTERFRKFVFGSNFLKLFDLSPEEIETLKTDDLALLKLGFKWLQFGLLGKSTLPVREEVIKAKEKELGVTLPKDDGLRKNPEMKKPQGQGR